MTSLPSTREQSGRTLFVRFGRWRIQMLRQDMFVYYDTFFIGQYRRLQIRPGDTVLDAGAGFGDFSIIASSKVGSKGIVLAVEPSALYYPLLLRNIDQNCLKNIIPLKVALSSKDGFASIEGRSLGVFEKTQAPSATITRLLSDSGIDHFDVVKMDIEGSEGELFRDTSWTRGVRELVMETHGATRDVVIPELLKLGYEINIFDGRSMIMNTLKSVMQHPAEFLRFETFSHFMALRHTVSFPVRPPWIVAPSNDFLRIIHATRHA